MRIIALHNYSLYPERINGQVIVFWQEYLILNK
jgi:hypothetical protein